MRNDFSEEQDYQNDELLCMSAVEDFFRVYKLSNLNARGWENLRKVWFTVFQVFIGKMLEGK